MKLNIETKHEENYVTVVEPLTINDFIIEERTEFNEFKTKPKVEIVYKLTFKPEIEETLNNLECKFYIPYSNTPRSTFYIVINERISKSKDPIKQTKNKEKALGIITYRGMQEKDALIEKEIKYLNEKLQEKFDHINQKFSDVMVSFYTGGIFHSKKNVELLKDFIDTDKLDSEITTLENQIEVLQKKKKSLETTKHNMMNCGMLKYCEQTKLDVPASVYDLIVEKLKEEKDFPKHSPSYNPWI